MEGTHSLFGHFAVIEDPRLNRKKKHKLIDIIVITVCGVICSSKTWVDIEEFGNSKLEWFKKFLELPNGIPSHDTFGRVFALIDNTVFQKAFQDWVQETFQLKKEGEIFPIDGKYFKASYREAGNPRSIVGLVNVWASEAGVALAAKKVDFYKEGEKQAYRDLISILNLKGNVVTMDAYGCHASITNRIVEKEGDFLVGLKANQKVFKRHVEELFSQTETHKIDVCETSEKSHGRQEKRTCQACEFPEDLLKLLNKRVQKNGRSGQEEWKGLKSICKITSERTLNGKTTVDERFYISSLTADAHRLLYTARSHWGVENKLHYVLDVAFMEDRSRLRMGDSAENFGVIRRLVFNLLKAEKTSKRSTNGKSLKAAWDNDYLERVIRGAGGLEIPIV